MPAIVESSKRKRLINFIVDLIIIALLMEITFRLEDLIDFKTPVKILRVIIVVGGYRIPMEYFFGKAVGKYITKTMVVDYNGNRITIKTALVRSLCRWIPFEYLSLGLGADAKAWHDTISNTHVIDDIAKRESSR
ncbi:MAG: RDD family protein [Bacteroidia bacterium]|nr:RDD family protein [Bacteroidia bacterium]